MSKDQYSTTAYYKLVVAFQRFKIDILCIDASLIFPSQG